jgi:hypothetical protein
MWMAVYPAETEREEAAAIRRHRVARHPGRAAGGQQGPPDEDPDASMAITGARDRPEGGPARDVQLLAGRLQRRARLALGEEGQMRLLHTDDIQLLLAPEPHERGQLQAGLHRHAPHVVAADAEHRRALARASARATRHGG